MLTPRRTLPYESQAPPRGTLFELPHSGEDREKARPDEQGRNPSAKPPEHTPATTDPPTLPQPVSGPCHSAGTNSPIQLNDEVDRGAEQVMKGPSSERNEQQHVTVPEDSVYGLFFVLGDKMEFLSADSCAQLWLVT